jgi:hypothetical protein
VTMHRNSTLVLFDILNASRVFIFASTFYLGFWLFGCLGILRPAVSTFSLYTSGPKVSSVFSFCFVKIGAKVLRMTQFLFQNHPT